jgi:hypothetical protein
MGVGARPAYQIRHNILARAKYLTTINPHMLHVSPEGASKMDPDKRYALPLSETHKSL